MTSKERSNLCIVYVWIVHRWIAYSELAQLDTKWSYRSTKIILLFPIISLYVKKHLYNTFTRHSCLYKGQRLTPLVFDILLRFRSHFAAIISDVEKVFHEVLFIPKHRNYLRFLWVDEVFKNSPSIVKLRLAQVVFGATSSPFLFNGTVWNHVSSYYFDREFVMQELRSFLVADFFCGSKTTTAAFELYKKLKIRFLEGQFNLIKMENER